MFLRSKKLFSLIVLLLGFLFLISPFAVYAIADPDDVEIVSIKVFQNLWESGDQLYVCEYNVEYSTDPTEDPEDTFLFQVYDGPTLMAQKPLPYYNYYMVAIYMDATDALTWGTGYNVRIGGNPSVPFPSGTPEDIRSLAPTDWIQGTLNGTTPDLIGEYLVQILEDLEDEYFSALSIVLVTADGKIDDAGKIIVTEEIPGILEVCPDYFESVEGYTDYTAETAPTAFQTSITAGMSTRLSDAMENFGVYFLGGANRGWAVGALGFALLFFVLAGRVFISTQSVPIAIVVSSPLLLLAGILGIVPMVIIWVVVIIVLVVFGITFILGRLA